MRKPLMFLFGIILLSSLGFLGYAFYDRYYYESEKFDRPVAFRYMRYACGECSPQWKLASPNSYNMVTMKISDKDVYIMYRNSKLEDILSEKDQACLNCKTVFVTGVLRQTWSGKCKIVADKYYFTTQENCCD